MPLVAITLVPASTRIIAAIVVTLAALAALGVVGARLGGAPAGRASLRVVAGGIFAMGVTMAIGAIVGTTIG